MRRWIPFLSALAICCLASGALASDQPYGWSISDSIVTPNSNQGVPTNGLATLYLWLVCCDVPDQPNGAPRLQGMAAAEFDLVPVGMQIFATTTQNGFLNAGGPQNLLLAVGGCPCGPVIAASILVFLTAGEICFAPSAQNGILGTVDCEPLPSLWGMDWVGYSTTGSPACLQGALCEKPISVEDASWGHIKALYK